ncbi:uncharacterized protein SCDLUD_000399 [Saccharomycodes ludwigii]|uniref:uncharacterized protein n=1 Tax=Saccharomycodes ludwigii TaxID=36035 RepID=UPI001E8A34F0|nr:hypothetical protein SCDLUD_000399 [Saccharomycodes ludwigii]KAH3902808.1 hypothetical protein SCDLUD_000399 [Saccharomycodes ludwigii]
MFTSKTIFKSSSQIKNSVLKLRLYTTNSNNNIKIPMAPTEYTFEKISKLIAHPHPGQVLVDVREPSELKNSGTIPGSLNIPYKSAPGSLNLPENEFKDLYSFDKPSKTNELIFYCAAGLRAKAAAELAQSFGYNKIGVYPGSMNEWLAKSGKIEKV